MFPVECKYGTFRTSGTAIFVRFLFLSLNIEHFCGQPTVGYMLQELKELRKSTSEDNALDSTYGRIIVTIKRQSKNRVAMALNTLCWLTKARRTLTIEELRIAVSIVPNSSELKEDFLADGMVLTDICAGLVVIDDNGTIRLAHFTVQKYLLRRNEIPAGADSTLAIACTTYLA